MLFRATCSDQDRRESVLNELGFEGRYLGLQLLYQHLHFLGGSHDIGSCPVLDLLGSLSELEGLHGLLNVAQLLTRCADQCGLGISTKSIFEEHRELRVTEWDMRTILGQGLNDETKRCQT